MPTRLIRSSEGTLLVAGVEWVRTDLNAEESVKKAGTSLFGLNIGGNSGGGDVEKTLAKQYKAAMIAGGLPVLGFITDEDKKDLGKLPFMAKTYALAEVFANMQELPDCAIFVSPLPEDPNYFVLVVAVNGMPSPQGHEHDRVVPADEVGEMVESWKYNLSNDLGKDAVVFGTHPNARSLTISEMLARAPGITPMRRVANDSKTLQVLIVAAVVVGGSYYGYQRYHAYQQKKAAEEQAKRLDPIKQYHDALAAQYPAIPWGSRTRTMALIKAALDQPLELGGFVFDKQLICQVPTGTCVGTYKRVNGGTFTAFATEAQTYKHFTSILYSKDGKTVDVTLQFDNLPAMGPPPDMALLPKEPPTFGPDSTTTGPMFDFWNAIQSLPTREKLEAKLEPVGVVWPPIPGLNETAVPKLIKIKTFSLTGALWKYSEMPVYNDPSRSPEVSARYRDLFNTPVNYKKVTFSWPSTDSQASQGSAMITLEGDLYVRKEN
jgi:hypothetical protein